MSMDVKLTTPCSILEANAGFSREMSLTNTRGETIEEELTWSVDSEIEVRYMYIDISITNNTFLLRKYI